MKRKIKGHLVSQDGDSGLFVFDEDVMLHSGESITLSVNYQQKPEYKILINSCDAYSEKA